MKTLPILILLFISLNSFSQDVLRLISDEKGAEANLGQMEWLSGYWYGTGLGGDCEELWMPALDNAMHGVFRLAINGQIRFTEYMAIEEVGGTLILKVKHFNRDLSAWEEKEDWVKFPLVKLEAHTAYFSGISFFRNGDSLSIKLAMRSGNESRIEEFLLTKKALGN
jgi:hypothetical protein